MKNNYFDKIDEALQKGKDTFLIGNGNFAEIWKKQENKYICIGRGNDLGIHQALFGLNGGKIHDFDHSIKLSSFEKLLNSSPNISNYFYLSMIAESKDNLIETRLALFNDRDISSYKQENDFPIISLKKPTFSESFYILNSMEFNPLVIQTLYQGIAMKKSFWDILNLDEDIINKKSKDKFFIKSH